MRWHGQAMSNWHVACELVMADQRQLAALMCCSASCAGPVHLWQRVHEQIRGSLMSRSPAAEHYPRRHTRRDGQPYPVYMDMQCSIMLRNCMI